MYKLLKTLIININLQFAKSFTFVFRASSTSSAQLRKKLSGRCSDGFKRATGRRTPTHPFR